MRKKTQTAYYFIKQKTKYFSFCLKFCDKQDPSNKGYLQGKFMTCDSLIFLTFDELDEIELYMFLIKTIALSLVIKRQIYIIKDGF